MSDAIREAFEAWWRGWSNIAPTRQGEGYAEVAENVAWTTWQAALQSQTDPAVPDGGEALAKIIKDAHMEGQKSATGREGTEFRWLHSDAKVTADTFLTAAPQPDHSPDAGKVVPTQALEEFAAFLRHKYNLNVAEQVSEFMAGQIDRLRASQQEGGE